MRLKPYVASLIPPALLVLGLPTRLPAYYAPCLTTEVGNVVVGQITKSINAAGQWQASAFVRIDITCGLGITSDCNVCICTHVDYFDGTNWITVTTGSTGVMATTAWCKMTRTYPVATVVAPLFPNYPPIMYRYTVDVRLWTGSACDSITKRGHQNFGR